MTGSGLRLRPLAECDEPEARQAHAELAADGLFLLSGPDRDVADEPWAELLARLGRERAGVDLPAGRVPASFLVAEVDGELVGRVSVRHRLNAHLSEVGGHIGYAVRPAHRGRGYATDILRQALTVARDVGVARALLTCDDDNAASAHVIERCGGVFERPAAPAPGAPPARRYWAPTG